MLNITENRYFEGAGQGVQSVKKFSVNLYKEYSYLKLSDLEELPCFGVMIWQPS